MIYIDASELKSTSRLRKSLPKLLSTFGYASEAEFLRAVTVTDLESRTGADLMLTSDTLPITTDTLLAMHISNGALLIQLKFGNDLAGSFGTRMHEAIHRMCSYKSQQYQRVLMFVGDVGCSRTGVLQINGRQSVPKRNYQAYHTAIRHWNRFGVVHHERREVHLADTLKNLERGISEPQRLEFWPAPPTPEDFDPDDIFSPASPVKDWRLTLSTFPGVGPKRATALMRAMEKTPGRRDGPTEFISVLHWVTATPEIRKQMRMPKIHLWGPKTFEACRRWMFGEDGAVEKGWGLMIDLKYEKGGEE